MKDICIEYSLPTQCMQRYTAIAFDGCYYYITDGCKEEVQVFDTSLCYVNCIETCRSYTAICYDTQDNCFWAASSSAVGYIFKLNECMQEIDRIKIISDKVCVGIITGISYCCDENCLLVTSGSIIYYVEKETGHARIMKKECDDHLITAVVCAYPLVIYYYIKNCRQWCAIINRYGEKIEDTPLSGEYYVQSALLYPCKDHFGLFHVYELVQKHSCYNYVLNIRLPSRISEEICYCNQELCDRCCKRHCHKQGCNGILESIALQEASIAHILNAEGEKLQKVIAESSDVCELLAVNESVQKTIIKATHLEHVLYAKLDAIESHCKCDDLGCHNPCPGSPDYPCNPCCAHPEPCEPCLPFWCE